MVALPRIVIIVAVHVLALKTAVAFKTRTTQALEIKSKQIRVASNVSTSFVQIGSVVMKDSCATRDWRNTGALECGKVGIDGRSRIRCRQECYQSHGKRCSGSLKKNGQYWFTLKTCADKGCHCLMRDKAKVLENLDTVWGIYQGGFAYPEWVKDVYAAKFFHVYDRDASLGAILYDHGTSAKAALSIATLREPAHIGSHLLFDQDRMQKKFGWRVGGYAESSGDGLAPNIAVMTVTPVTAKGQVAAIAHGPRLHILSVIAYAFDSRSQPDHQYFLEQIKENGKPKIGRYQITAGKRQELLQWYGCIFDKVFHAAISYKLKVIVLSKFGAGAFGTGFPGSIWTEFWLPALEDALSAWSSQLTDAGVTQLSVMGATDDEFTQFRAATSGYFPDPRNHGYFPDPLREELGGSLSDAMIVNAWDPWSIIGNGNSNDQSVDGYVGRTSGAGMLGWPKTNSYLQENLIEVTRPR